MQLQASDSIKSHMVFNDIVDILTGYGTIALFAEAIIAKGRAGCNNWFVHKINPASEDKEINFE